MLILLFIITSHIKRTRRAVPCINVFSPFQSPWARKKEDEDYLSRTLTRLGEIVKDDVKLGTVYLTLVLATPPSEATEETKASTEQDDV